MIDLETYLEVWRREAARRERYLAHRRVATNCCSAAKYVAVVRAWVIGFSQGFVKLQAWVGDRKQAPVACFRPRRPPCVSALALDGCGCEFGE